MARMVISFRSTDGAAFRDRLYQHLAEHYGVQSVAYGVDELVRPGDDYLEAISAGVQQAALVLVVMGPGWAEGDWLSTPDDWDYLALKAAIEHHTRLIPILVDGTPLPLADDLPAELQSLGRRKPLAMGTATFEVDVQPLDAILQAELQPATPPPPIYGPPPGFAGPYGPPPFIAMHPSPYARLGLEPADMAARTGAFIVDAIILTFVGLLLMLGARSAVGPENRCSPVWYDPSGTYCYDDYSNANALGYVLVLGFGLVFHGYFLTRHNGQTPGKMLAGVRIVKDNGEPLGIWDATVRNVIGYGLSGVILLLGFIWAFLDQDRKGWHDMLANTIVVQA